MDRYAPPQSEEGATSTECVAAASSHYYLEVDHKGVSAALGGDLKGSTKPPDLERLREEGGLRVQPEAERVYSGSSPGGVILAWSLAYLARLKQQHELSSNPNGPRGIASDGPDSPEVSTCQSLVG
eukprot:8749555-Pyramimonas_sp.AAC.1